MMTFSSSDSGLDFSQTSMTKKVGEVEFTLEGGTTDNGIGFYVQGINAMTASFTYELTITIADNYMFSLDSIDAIAGLDSSNFQIKYKTAMGEDYDTTVTGVNTASLSSYPVDINNVTQVVLSSVVAVEFNNIQLSNIKLIPDLPAATTSAASDITNTSVTLNGIVNAQGDSTKVEFQYRRPQDGIYLDTVEASSVEGTGDVPVSTVINGLTPNTTYYYRVVATNAAGSSSGEELYFTTLDPISDFSKTSTSATTAEFSWTAATGATGIVIEQSPAGANIWTTANTGTIAVDAASATVSGLTAGTSYDFRMVVTGGTKAGTSNLVSVTTDSLLAYYGYQTRTISEITSLRLIGIIRTLDADMVGFVYSTSDTTPVIDEAECDTLSTNQVYTSIKANNETKTAVGVG